MTHDSRLLGVILAGGRSTRYGRPKAFAQVGGARIIDRARAALGHVTSDVVLIANDPALAAQVPLRWRSDILPDAGALGGIHAALQWAADESQSAILAVACDMPFLSIPLLQTLVARGVRAGGADVVIPESSSRRGVEPLCAFYSVRCLGAIERAIEAGDRRMVGFHDEVDVERIPLDDVETFGDPRELFLNVNTPEDREQAEDIEIGKRRRQRGDGGVKTLHREADWLTVEQATARILERVQPLDPESVRIVEAVGRVLVGSVVSPIDHPPWDNSAMDGFAARTADVRGAARENPATLRVIESVPAGGFPSLPIRAGEAIEIMTGAPIPDGADCVIRVEHTRREHDHVIVLDDMDAGRNVRPRGEDVRAGQLVLEAGRVLRPAEIALLATVGRATVEVHRRPRVAILSTGDELADLDDFDDVLAGRKIANSNSYGLAAALRAAGAEPRILGIARDNADSLREHLERALAADGLVTTAGASVGEHDLVKDALEDVGMDLAFWRVQMRPGSPFSFGLMPRPDRPALPVFALPGNPVSALVTFEVLVRPAVRRMAGHTSPCTRTVRVRAAEDIASKPGLVHYLRVKLRTDGAGGWLARLTGPQGSGLITSMTQADALLIVPLDSAGIAAGEWADAIWLRDDCALEL